MKKVSGFTLIELMIVVAVVAILAAFAITNYTNQIRKSKRAEAKQVLSDVALRQEKFRATHASYSIILGDDPSAADAGLNYSGGAGALATKTPSGFYGIALSTPTGGNCPGVTPVQAIGVANSFRITATATGDQAPDTDCATLVLTSLCGRVSKTSTGGGTCW